jgi:hypothetical protein
MALAPAGCGSGDDSSSPQTTSEASSTPTETTPTETETTPTDTTPTDTTPTTTTPQRGSGGAAPRGSGSSGGGGHPGEGGSGGGGDEGGNRIPVNFRLAAGGAVKPRTVRVPAFFLLAVRVRNTDSRSHAVKVRGTSDTLAPGRALTARIQGHKPATYRVMVDGRQRGKIVTGAQPGP